MGYNNIFSFTFPVKNNSSSISLVWNSIQFFVLISIYAKFYIIIHNQASAVFDKCLIFRSAIMINRSSIQALHKE